MSMKLLEGSEAIAEAALAAGLKFYSAYPMSPSTELLEHFARKLPQRGGVCINADTEIEGVMMAIGAATVGARCATGSTGQGVALMQEAIAEAALTELPLVVFTMGRAQQDYFQSTRGGGWGDYRTITLAPKDVPEAVEHTQLLFHLADQYRCPCILLGDNILARTQVGVDVRSFEFPSLPPKDWAFDGKSGGTGRAKSLWSWGIGKENTLAPGGVQGHWERLAAKFERIEAAEQRHEEAFVDDAEVLVVAFGTAAKFVEYIVRELRAQGERVGFFRPISLWPFPGAALERASRHVRRVAVFEVNAGQMIEDVRLHVRDRDKVSFIGGISTDEAGINLGTLMSGPAIRARIRAALAEVTA